jgi:serine/threonine protein kinase
MNEERWRLIKDIFERAQTVEEDRREFFLNQNCGSDRELLQQIRQMLSSDQRKHPRLDQPFLDWSTTDQLTPNELQPEPRIIGHYRLIRRVGRPSGMGEVFEALDQRPQMNRKVAIKLMLDKLSEQDIRRFQDEAQSLARLNHPNVITLYDSGEHNGRPYLVMEYFEGESLQERLERGPLESGEMIDITRQICKALEAAHAKGIIHRDIKPANIMVRKESDVYNVKLLDFGVAILEGVGTRTLYTDPSQKVFIGTALYTSPEQAAGKRRREIDHRADLYSLGAVVYQMTTGQRLFQADNAGEFLNHHQFTTPAPPSLRSPELKIATEIDPVIMKALEKTPSDRFQSASEFFRALQNAVEKPFAPPPGGKAYLLWIIALFLVLFGGVIYSGLLSTPGGDRASTSTTPAPTDSKAAADARAGKTPSATPHPIEIKTEVTQEGVGVAPLNKVFHQGDAVRVIATAEQDGRLYLLIKGSSGPAHVLYPTRDIPENSRTVQAGQRIEAPSPTSRTPWLRFDHRAGVETLYLVFSVKPDEPLLRLLDQALKRSNQRLPASIDPQTLKLFELRASGGDAPAPSLVVKKIELTHER